MAISKVRLPDNTEQEIRDAQTAATVSNLSVLVASLSSSVEALSTNEAVIAWDGASVPDVSLIPEGVIVEYGGTTYEGELEADSTTAGKTYMVGEEDSETMHRYVSVVSGNDYIWVDYGSTDIVLTDYIRKDDEVWLTEEAFKNLPVKDPTKTYNVYEEVAEI